MKLLQLLSKIEDNQRIIIEMTTQSILNVPIGSFRLINKFDESLQNYYDIEVFSICVGDNGTICIKV